MNDRNHGYGDIPRGDGAPGGGNGPGGYGGEGDPYARGNGPVNPYANPMKRYGNQPGPGGPGQNGPGQQGSGAYGGGDAETQAYGAYGAYGGPGGSGGPNNPGGPGGPGGPQGPGGPNGPYGSGGYEGPSSSASSGSGSGGNKGILIGIAALVGVIVLVGAAFLFMRGDEDPEKTGETTTVATETEGTTTRGTDGATPSSRRTTPTTTSTAAGPADPGDGSLAEPYASAVPAYVRDHVQRCSRGRVKITSYDTNVEDREVPGMRCSGAKGSLFERKLIEIIDDDEFSKNATDQARRMDYEVIEDAGGVKILVAAYQDGKAKVYWADENKGMSLESYTFDSLADAKAAAEQLK